MQNSLWRYRHKEMQFGSRLSPSGPPSSPSPGRGTRRHSWGAVVKRWEFAKTGSAENPDSLGRWPQGRPQVRICDTLVTWGGAKTHQQPWSISQARWRQPAWSAVTTSSTTGRWSAGPLGDDQCSQSLAHAHYASPQISLLDTDTGARKRTPTRVHQHQHRSRENSLLTKSAGVKGLKRLEQTLRKQSSCPHCPWRRQEQITDRLCGGKEERAGEINWKMDFLLQSW